MSSATPSRLGAINSGADGTFANDFALMLKVFAGEIIHAFDEKNVMLPLTMVRTISSGKSAQFPVTWKATAAYHVPGAEILGSNQINQNEKVINIDAVLLANAFIAKIDEAMNHYDLRAEYAKQLAASLSKKLDQNLLKLAILAARASASVTGGNAGSVLTAAGYGTTADTLAQGILDAAQALDEKDVPEDERYCVLSPAKYNLLVTSTKAINRDWNEGVQNGNFASGKVFKIAGVNIVKSNHLPTGVEAAVDGEENTYSGTFTTTVGVVFHKSAVGTVKLMDLQTENAYDIRRQGTLFIAKYAMGHGILRPEAAVELKTA